jgi:hypothetical protein
MYPEQLQMALLKRKRLVRFGTQELTFVEGPERENLVESRCGAVAVGSAYLFPPLSPGGASLAEP